MAGRIGHKGQQIGQDSDFAAVAGGGAEGVVRVRLIPKNWSQFQHYKNRNPPWIKLHKPLLDDYEFQCLPLASKALAPMLWLLASESQEHETGAIDGDYKKLAFRLRLTEKVLEEAIKALIDKGFFTVEDDDSALLAERKRLAILEKEKEAEAEREKEAETDRQNGLDFTAWGKWIDYRIKIGKPYKPVSIPSAKLKLSKFLENQNAVVEQSIANGYQGLFALSNNEAVNGKQRPTTAERHIQKLAELTGENGRTVDG